jgi:hypothetical protein
VGKRTGVRGKQPTADCAFLMDTGTTFFIFSVLPNKVAEALTRFFFCFFTLETGSFEDENKINLNW